MCACRGSDRVAQGLWGRGSHQHPEGGPHQCQAHVRVWGQGGPARAALWRGFCAASSSFRRPLQRPPAPGAAPGRQPELPGTGDPTCLSNLRGPASGCHSCTFESVLGPSRPTRLVISCESKHGCCTSFEGIIASCNCTPVCFLLPLSPPHLSPSCQSLTLLLLTLPASSTSDPMESTPD